MLTEILLAPATGGKTTHAINLARETAVSLQAEVRVCVPTGLQARAWRHRLAAAGGAVGVHVLTFDRLVATCLNEAGEAYTELSEPVLYRLLRQIIDQLPLQHYAPLKTKPGFIQIVHQLIVELKSALIYPESFVSAISTLGGTPRLQELADIYTAYQAQLQAQGWADRVGLHWLAVKALSERAPDVCKNWPILIVDGFDDFTPSQLALIHLLANRVGRCTITLPQTEQVTYPRYHNTLREVETKLGITGTALPNPETIITRQPTLHHLAHHLFSLTTDDPIANDGALTLREVSDRMAEVRTALRWLKQQIVWHRQPANQTALLARDIAPYRPFIQQIAAEFGLPLYLVDGQPLQQSPVIASLMTLLRLHLPVGADHEPDLPRRQVIISWRSPYFFWGGDELSITSADADTLDSFARQQRVIRGLTQWEAAFAAAKTAKDSTNIDDDDEGGGEQLTGTAVARLENKFAHFLNTTRPPTTATTMREFVQWLETLIGPDPQLPGYTQPPIGSLQIVAQARRSKSTAEADIAALCTLKDILRGLVWAEDAVGQNRPVDYTYFFNELSGAIAAAHFMLPVPSGQPGIIIANVIQVRGLSFASVALMGLSEGSFPTTISEDPFLRDADRQILREKFGFPLESSTQSAEREFFYEAITRARHKLLLTRPILADNGAEWVASPFWEAVRQLIEVEPESIPSERIIPLEDTASRAEWWETLAAAYPESIDGQPVQSTREWQHLQSAAQIWQLRQAKERSVWEGDLTILSAELSAQFGSEHMWSASRLEAYQVCGFLFYLQNILKVEPRPEPAEGLDIRQLGRVYHHIFEKVMESGPPESLEETVVYDWVTAVAAPILDAAPEQEGFRETAWWSQTRLGIINNVVRTVCKLPIEGYEFRWAEAEFGFSKPPLVIQDGADRLQLRGFIDRIDRHSDGSLRIIDYKSSSEAAYTPTTFSQGKKLQLPLYALAAQEALKLGVVATGFYWHFQQAEASGFELGKAEGGVDGAIETAVRYAWDAVHHIRSGQFTPKPPDTGCPTYCPAAAFCWQYTPKSR